MNKTECCNTSLFECYELQLSEIEMLSSMYPDSNEFSISLPSILIDINSYISKKSHVIPSELDFNLNLDIDGIKDKLEVNVTLPHDYPFQKPSVCARSNGLNRTQQRELNSGISIYISTLYAGDLCILSVINWVTENAGKYFTLQDSAEKEDSLTESVTDEFCRMWIYSHHIYNKFKRREIVDSAVDLKLTGFSLPGKPGVICIEGFKQSCFDFYQSLKQLSWKKLSLVKEESAQTNNEVSLDEFRRFKDFQEISFTVKRGPCKEYHMDMGQFLKYLDEHDCSYIFQELFGLEGRSLNEK